MSLAGQVLWKRQTIGACDFAIIGKPSVVLPAATPDATFRNLRREPVCCERDSAFAGTSDFFVMTPPENWRRCAMPGMDLLINPETACRGCLGGKPRAPLVIGQCIPGFSATSTAAGPPEPRSPMS